MALLVDSGTSPNLETSLYRGTFFRVIQSKKCTRQAVCAARGLFIDKPKEIFFKMSIHTKNFNS